MHLALAGGRLWRKLTSICEHKRAPVEHIILFFPSGDLVSVGLQIVLRDQKSKEGFKYQSVEIYWSEQRAGLFLRQESYKEATTKSIFTGHL